MEYQIKEFIGKIFPNGRSIIKGKERIKKKNRSTRRKITFSLIIYNHQMQNQNLGCG
jgi:hypothetical protein